MACGFSQKNNPTLVAPDMPIDDNTKLITYKEVIPEKGTAKELYDRAMKWAKKYYKNTAEVIKNANETEKVIDFRSSVRIYTHLKDGTKQTKNVVYYDFKLECREGRYRYIITNFNERATAAAPIERWMNPEDKKWNADCFLNLKEVDDQIQELLGSLFEGMQPEVVKEDEW